MWKGRKKGESGRFAGEWPANGMAGEHRDWSEACSGGAFSPFDKLKNIAGFLRRPKKVSAKNRCDRSLKGQENRRTETAGRLVSPQEGRWMYMIIMNYPSIGLG
jgi:hypothetical protein